MWLKIVQLSHEIRFNEILCLVVYTLAAHRGNNKGKVPVCDGRLALSEHAILLAPVIPVIVH